MVTARIRALIVDDEPLARERIRCFLKDEPDVELVGESVNGAAAVRDIGRLKPDLLFLDVQMPELDGFGVLQTLGPEGLPCTIFVTAFDKYALQAFEVHALDYLLKPFDRKRFRHALNRARERLQRPDDAALDRRLRALIEDLTRPPKYVQRVVVKSEGRVILVPVQEVDWFEGAGNYVRLHVGSTQHLVRDTMAAVQERLDPEKFVRIHRSHIVNVDSIQELQPVFHGDYVVILKNGTELTLSRSYRHSVQDRLGVTF